MRFRIDEGMKRRLDAILVPGLEASKCIGAEFDRLIVSHLVMDPAKKDEVLATVEKVRGVSRIVAWTSFLGSDDVTLIANDCGSIARGCVHQQFMATVRALIPGAPPDQLSCLVGDRHRAERRQIL